jgi:hypothetical protein
MNMGAFLGSGGAWRRPGIPGRCYWYRFRDSPSGLRRRAAGAPLRPPRQIPARRSLGGPFVASGRARGVPRQRLHRFDLLAAEWRAVPGTIPLQLGHMVGWRHDRRVGVHATHPELDSMAHDAAPAPPAGRYDSDGAVLRLGGSALRVYEHARGSPVARRLRSQDR